MKCLETRVRADGIKMRRYELEDGRRTTTFELPASVVKAIGLKRVQEFMEIWQRGEKQRSRRQRIEELLRERVKPTAIAHEVGCTDQRVRQIRKKMEQTDEL
jgi:protein-disulfide isomerase-like protein with CxxC motif